MASNVFNTNSANYNGGNFNGRATAVTAGGGVQLKLTDEEALATFASTGMFNGTYYSSAIDSFHILNALLSRVSPEFAAKAAVYSKRYAKLKDMPAFLLCALSDMDKEWFRKAFPHVCVNGKDITNFVQILRSGATGHTSVGSTKKKALQSWFDNAGTAKILNASIGGNGVGKVSLVDVIRIAHIKAKPEHQELFRWLMGYGDLNMAKLPEAVSNFIDFKSDTNQAVNSLPEVPFLMYQGLQMSDANHLKLLDLMTFNQLRQNLAAFIRRHGFNSHIQAAIELKFTPDNVRNSGMLPHAMISTYKMLSPIVPRTVARKLEECLEASLENSPVLPGRSAVYVDTSGSMSYDASGGRHGRNGGTSMTEIAAVFAYGIAQKNPNVDIYFFDTSIEKVSSGGSFYDFAERAESYCGGGTDIRLAINNFAKQGYDSGVIISDNECNYGIRRLNNPFDKMHGKLAFWDIQPGFSSNIVDGKKSIYTSGLNDSVNTILSDFFDEDANTVSLVDRIKAIEI